MDHLLSFGFDIRANDSYTQIHQRCSRAQVVPLRCGETRLRSLGVGGEVGGHTRFLSHDVARLMISRLAIAWLCSLAGVACAGKARVGSRPAPAPQGAAPAFASARATAAPTQDYLALVASEAVD